MFLLSEDLIRRYIDRRRMRIRDLAQSNLYPTCYYFRLGFMAEVSSTSGMNTVDLRKSGGLVIPPGSVAQVNSFERFELADNILGLLGNQTKFPMEKGLQLLHGPSIDPGFDDFLTLALLNIGGTDVRLDYKDTIGKAMFFDISDSALEETRLSESAAARKARLRDMYGTDDENPDAPYMATYE